MIQEYIEYDVIIIGAGAAGLTAGMYTSRKRLKTLIISIDIGGQTNLTSNIENYPGINPLQGSELMQKFREQAQSFGCELIMGNVKRISKQEKNIQEKKIFVTELFSGEEYFSRSIILAFGKVPRKLGIPGEERFLGRGVSTCVTCDGPFYTDKTTAIIGGGNSAIEGAIELGRICKNVYLIHRRKEFRADEVSLEKLRSLKNIKLILEYVPTEIKGDKNVKSITLENVHDKTTKELQIDGLFLEIGYVVDTSMVKDLCEVNEKKEIIVDMHCRTSTQGLFACGDVTQLPYKQTIIAAGEGAKAALSAYEYLTK